MLDESRSSYFGNLVIVHRTLQAYGLDADAIVSEAGIQRSLYKDPTHRIPAELMDRLFSLCYEKTQDPSFSLECINHIGPTYYHALGVGLLYSSTLREFCQRFERFFSLITTLDSLKFIDDAQDPRLTMQPQTDLSEDIRRFDSDIINAILLKFIRLIYRPDYAPRKVSLTWTPPSGYQQKYLDHFGCELAYSAPVTAFHFNKDDLDAILPASNVDLARQNDKVVMDFLARTEKIDLPSRVYSKLIELLPSGECSREQVAKALNMSPSNFDEKLKKAGTNYQGLRDATRKELAESYLRREDVSISEIAYLLGFSDTSNFTRSFKRWFDVSPREYRKTRLT